MPRNPNASIADEELAGGAGGAPRAAAPSTHRTTPAGEAFPTTGYPPPQYG